MKKPPFAWWPAPPAAWASKFRNKQQPRESPEKIRSNRKHIMPSKRYKKAVGLLDPQKSYVLKSAVDLLVQFPKAKFDETVEVAFRLGVDPKQSDQMVRGTVPLPHGSGKTVRVLVFAKNGPAADAA